VEKFKITASDGNQNAIPNMRTVPIIIPSPINGVVKKNGSMCKLCEQVRVERSCKVHLVRTRYMDTVVNTKALSAERGWVTVSP
jgi:hypothetical protein